MIRSRKAPRGRGIVVILILLVLLAGAIFWLAGSVEKVPIETVTVEVDRNAAGQ